MATTVTKIFDDEHIEVIGDLNENSPNVKDSLVAYYPFDETTVGQIPEQNLLDDSVWVAGTSGSVGEWARVGDTPENTRIYKDNPFGAKAVVWASEANDVGSNSDGGFENFNHAIDRTKTYRLSVWIRRENVGNGRTYLGTQGSTVWNLGTTTVNTNPYFTNCNVTELPELENNWILFVGHVHATSYGGTTHVDSGCYTMSGTKIRNMTDYKWTSSATVGGHRSFLYYSTSTTERQYLVEPRMEIVDSTTSTIEDLLKGRYNIKYPLTDTNTLLNTYGLGSQGGYHTTTNVALNPTGSDGAGVPGSYTPGWDTSLHPTAFTVSTWSGGYNGGVGSPTIGYHAQWVNEGVDGTACMKFIDENWRWGLGHRWLGISEQVSGNVDTSWDLVTNLKTVTLSWDQKVNTIGKVSRVGLYHKESGASGFGTAIANHSNTVINQWERITWTYTVTSAWDAGTFMNFYFYGSTGDYGTLWVDNVQLEIDRDYNTAFVESTSSDSYLRLENPIKTGGDFTVNFWCKVLPSVLTVGSYHTIFSMGEYNTNNSFTIMDDDGTDMLGEQRLIRRGNAAEWNWASAAFTNSGNFQDWNMYTVVRGTSYYQCYANGVYVGNVAHLSTTMQNNIYIGSKDGPTRLCPSYFKKLSFYDKALTTDEITSLYGIASMKTDGDLVIDYACEPNPNIWPDPDLSTTSYPVTGGAAATSGEDIDGRYHQLVLSSQTWARKGWSIIEGARIGLTYYEGIEVGATYIASGYFWKSTGSSLPYVMLRITNSGSGSVSSALWSSISEETWTYASVEFIADAEQDCLIYPSNATAGTGTVRWRNISVSKKIGKSLVFNNTRDLYTRDIIDE